MDADAQASALALLEDDVDVAEALTATATDAARVKDVLEPTAEQNNGAVVEPADPASVAKRRVKGKSVVAADNVEAASGSKRKAEDILKRPSAASVKKRPCAPAVKQELGDDSAATGHTRVGEMSSGDAQKKQTVFACVMS